MIFEQAGHGKRYTSAFVTVSTGRSLRFFLLAIHCQGSPILPPGPSLHSSNLFSSFPSFLGTRRSCAADKRDGWGRISRLGFRTSVVAQFEIVPKGQRKLAGGGASPRAQPPDSTPRAIPSRRDDGTTRVSFDSSTPAGADSFSDRVRWFPLADSLHHRLISSVPPGQWRTEPRPTSTVD